MALGNFLAELKRRQVYRAGAAYAVAAFGLIEIVSNVAPMFDLPAWIGRAVVLVLITGFPLTLFLAWMIEGKPAVGAEGPSASKLDLVLAGAVVLVIGLLIYQQVTPAQKTMAGAAPAEGVSIAVLPFVNLSGDPAQEFFSDGMTEEITSALAKVKGLRVVGRTSAFEFKGQNKDLRAIGQALGTANLLEGSVRKVGNRVRITGQLIRAGDGSHIWTENYDRELTDIFATQDDIARAIATALRVPLGLKAGEALVANRTDDTDAYQDYLRAKALFRSRGNAGSAPALAAPTQLLEQVVRNHPDYAPAWALLATVYGNAPGYNVPLDVSEERRFSDASLLKAEAAARRAIELAPDMANAHAGLAFVLDNRRKFSEAEDRFSQALALDALDPDTLHFYSLFLAKIGRVKEAATIRRQLGTLEPLVPIFNAFTANILLAAGQNDSALAIAAALPPNHSGRGAILAEIYAAMGRFGEAAEAIQSLEGGRSAGLLLQKAPTVLDSKDLPDLPDARMSYVYLYVGAPARALDAFDRSVNAFPRYSPYISAIYSPAFSPARKTARFKELMLKTDLVDYWRARGWPDVCRPVGADDFACD